MKNPTWFGRRIVNEAHKPDIEHAAAIYEFEHGLPRDEAETRAYGDYIAQHHKEAAAHHLRGMRAASGAGDIDEAHKHGIAFAMHMQALDHDPMDAVPEEIKKLAEGDDKKPHYKFKAHKADQLLLDD